MGNANLALDNRPSCTQPRIIFFLGKCTPLLNKLPFCLKKVPICLIYPFSFRYIAHLALETLSLLLICLRFAYLNWPAYSHIIILLPLILRLDERSFKLLIIFSAKASSRAISRQFRPFLLI